MAILHTANGPPRAIHYSRKESLYLLIIYAPRRGCARYVRLFRRSSSATIS